MSSPQPAQTETGPSADAADRRVAAGRVARVGATLSVAVLLVAPGRGALAAVERPWLVGLTFSAAALGLWSLAVSAKHRMAWRSGVHAQAARGNLAAALVLVAHQLSVAFIASRALTGIAFADLVPGLVFAFVGLATWAIFVMLFRALTVYDDAQEITGENHAAALSYAGAAVALAIIIAHAVDGRFAGWVPSAIGYARALGLAFALYPVRQLVVQGLFLGGGLHARGRGLDRAIAQERRLDVAAVEAGTYVATALLLTGLV